MEKMEHPETKHPLWDAISNKIINKQNSRQNIEDSKNSPAASVQQLKDSIPLLNDAVHSISGDYCSYDDRNSALRKINAVVAVLESI